MKKSKCYASNLRWWKRSWSVPWTVPNWPNQRSTYSKRDSVAVKPVRFVRVVAVMWRPQWQRQRRRERRQRPNRHQRRHCRRHLHRQCPKVNCMSAHFRTVWLAYKTLSQDSHWTICDKSTTQHRSQCKQQVSTRFQFADSDIQQTKQIRLVYYEATVRTVYVCNITFTSNVIYVVCTHIAPV